jgi:hypothetical protein
MIDQPPFHGILMNVISMMHEIQFVANPVICKSSLPDLLISANDCPEFVRVGTFDQLDCAFDRYIQRGSQQEMHVFGHDDESMQFVAAFATIPIDSLQEEADIDFDHEQFAAVVRRKSHEIGSRWRDESSRLQGETSAAESRTSVSTLNWHEWNSCPSRLILLRRFSFRERTPQK